MRIDIHSTLLTRCLSIAAVAMAVLLAANLVGNIPFWGLASSAAGIFAIIFLFARNIPKSVTIDVPQSQIFIEYRKWSLKQDRRLDLRPFNLVRSYVAGQIPEVVFVELATQEEVPRTLCIGTFTVLGSAQQGGLYSNASEPQKAFELRNKIETLGVFVNQGYLLDFPERRGIKVV